MKTYVKPIIDVVELSVRENIAKLPTAIQNPEVGTYSFGGTEVPVTVYNLASVKTSEEA